MLEQYQDIMTAYEVTEALCIGKTVYMSCWEMAV